ncbi:hypothetical protein [Klebsiella pneumoniae]|uniref:hypothetical protein n=1 Tax=Klebsiella pneumoniae TaxID=573 RepID=UPI003872E4EF
MEVQIFMSALPFLEIGCKLHMKLIEINELHNFYFCLLSSISFFKQDHPQHTSQQNKKHVMQWLEHASATHLFSSSLQQDIDWINESPRII